MACKNITSILTIRKVSGGDSVSPNDFSILCKSRTGSDYDLLVN